MQFLNNHETYSALAKELLYRVGLQDFNISVIVSYPYEFTICLDKTIKEKTIKEKLYTTNTKEQVDILLEQLIKPTIENIKTSQAFKDATSDYDQLKVELEEVKKEIIRLQTFENFYKFDMNGDFK